MLRWIYSAIYGEINVSVLVCVEMKGDYVEIKCQLDAKHYFYCRSYCLNNMFRAPLCPSSGVLYRWLLPVVFGALVFKLSEWCGAEGYVSGLRAGQTGHTTLSS